MCIRDRVKEGENFVDKTKEEVELKSNPKGTETKANEGYKFSHWTADKEITLNDGTKIAAGEKITEEQLKQAVITEPLTFKANFVKDEFKVTHEFKEMCIRDSLKRGYRIWGGN